MSGTKLRPITKEDLLSVEHENFRRLRDKVTLFVKTPHHSVRKLTNRALGALDRRLRHEPKALAMPSHLMVEPTTACQLKCPLCPVGNGMLERPPRFADLDVYRRVIDELAPYLYHVNFNGSGEPLLHPRIVEMASYAASKNIYSDLYTNLQTVDAAVLDQLPSSGLDRILISLDGADKETYEAYRVLGDFDRICANIRRLVQKRDATKDSPLAIDIQMVVMRRNEQQIAAVQRLVEQLGADSLILKRTFLFSGTGDPKETLSYLTDNDALRLYERDPAKVDTRDRDQPAAFKGRDHKTCPVLWASAVLLCDGRVSPCCFDYHGWVILGDAKVQPFREIWNGPKYQEFRAAVTRDWRSVKLCSSMIGGCPTMRLEPTDWVVKNPWATR